MWPGSVDFSLPRVATITMRMLADTKKKLAEKKAAGTWAGRPCQMPALRLGGGGAAEGGRSVFQGLAALPPLVW